MNNSLLYIAENLDQHCAEPRLSNLVKLDRRPDRNDSTTELTCLGNPSSRNQRCIRYSDCFRGHVALVRPIEADSRSVKDVVEGNQANRKADLIRFSSMAPKSVSISSSLDRQLKDNQGGCLYEWPCSQIIHTDGDVVMHGEHRSNGGFMVLRGLLRPDHWTDGRSILSMSCGRLALLIWQNVQSNPGTDAPCQPGGWRRDANHTCH